MRISTDREGLLAAREVRFDGDMMYVRLTDGRIIGIPLEWFPRLARAAPSERENWRLVGGGVGIHWPELDEDVSVPALLK